MDLFFAIVFGIWIMAKMFKWAASGSGGGLSDMQKQDTFNKIGKKK